MNLIKQSPLRKTLARFAGWFFAANTLLYLVAGLMYLPYLPNIHSAPLLTDKGMIFAWGFALMAFTGQFAVFAFAACTLALLIIFFIPRRSVAFTVSILLGGLVAWFLIADGIVYHLYRFHLAGLVWQIVRSGAFFQVIPLSIKEWIIAFGLFFALLVVEFGLAMLVWRRVNKTHGKKSRSGLMVAGILIGSLYLSYLIYLNLGTFSGELSVRAKSNDHMVVLEAQLVPYYNDVLGILIPARHAARGLEAMNEGYFAQNKQINKPLVYPLHRLQASASKQKPLNVVVIAIDTWRADMMNKTLTPDIYRFAQHAIRFNHHFSGGNATRPGIFSLFYGLPANYWTAMLKQQHGPVLIKQFIKDHYQMGIFASATLDYPNFKDTVFRDVKNLQVETPGDDPQQRDEAITHEFKHFIHDRKHNKPFFSFLFYDSVHGFCESGSTYAKPYQPAVKSCDRVALTNSTNPLPYINAYKNAVVFDDGLVGKDLQALRDHHLLKNTIVIITADHGEEFNDEHQGFWGHASAFDPYQVKVPFIVYWPGKHPHAVNYLTTHYDLVPTLMKNVLHVTSPASYYTVGHSLFKKKKEPYFIVGSYVDYAILKPNRVTTIFPDGNYSITYSDLKPIPNATLQPKTLHEVFTELHKYFK